MKYIFKDSCIGVSVFRQAGAEPTITLVSVVNITDSTANVNVSIADGEDVSKTGVEIDTDPLFSNPTQYEENGAVNTIAVDNLNTETTYYVRAYVIWSGQTIYSANSLNFTTAQTSILPAELQGCEYLQTDGNCYIDTGILYNSNDEIIIKLSIDTTANNYIFGSYRNIGGGNNRYSFVGYRKSDSIFCVERTRNGTMVQLNANATIENIIFEIAGIAMKIKDFDGNVIAQRNAYNDSYSTDRNITLFAANHLGTIEYAKNGKIYNFYCLNKRNMYSCYIKSGQTYTDNKGNVCGAGTCGMYDIVNQVFYTNDGTGTFIVGGDINI